MLGEGWRGRPAGPAVHRDAGDLGRRVGNPGAFDFAGPGAALRLHGPLDWDKVGPPRDSSRRGRKAEPGDGRISARSGEASNGRAAFGPGLPSDELPALESASRLRVRFCSGRVVLGSEGANSGSLRLPGSLDYWRPW